MAKVQREMITVSASYYNFDERYEKAMARFDDESIHVISVNLVSRKETDDSTVEKYLVFYQEIEVDEDENLTRYGRYNGSSESMIELRELSKLNPDTKISTVLVNQEIVFQGLRLTPASIMEDWGYWVALEEKENGTLSFVVEEKTLA